MECINCNITFDLAFPLSFVLKVVKGGKVVEMNVVLTFHTSHRDFAYLPQDVAMCCCLSNGVLFQALPSFLLCCLAIFCLVVPYTSSFSYATFDSSVVLPSCYRSGQFPSLLFFFFLFFWFCFSVFSVMPLPLVFAWSLSIWHYL